MILFVLLIALAVSGFVGFKLGGEIRGTTIGGLKVAMVFGSAVIGLAAGTVCGLLGLGVAAIAGLAGAAVLPAIAAGLGGGLAGCGLGYLVNR